MVQIACFFAKTRRLAFFAGVNLGFRVGLCDFRRNSLLKCQLIALRVTSVWATFERILLQELAGNYIAILFAAWSFRLVVFPGSPTLSRLNHDSIVILFSYQSYILTSLLYEESRSELVDLHFLWLLYPF